MEKKKQKKRKEEKLEEQRRKGKAREQGEDDGAAMGGTKKHRVGRVEGGRGWGGDTSETRLRPFKHWPRQTPVAFRVFGKVRDSLTVHGHRRRKTADVEKASIGEAAEGERGQG